MAAGVAEASNHAETVCEVAIDVVQVDDDPVHAPFHPTNTDPAFGVAVSVTAVSAEVKLATQLPAALSQAGGLIAAPVKEMVPAPVPVNATVIVVGEAVCASAVVGSDCASDRVLMTARNARRKGRRRPSRCIS